MPAEDQTPVQKLIGDFSRRWFPCQMRFCSALYGSAPGCRSATVA
jgi:hypothetical protein